MMFYSNQRFPLPVRRLKLAVCTIAVLSLFPCQGWSQSPTGPVTVITDTMIEAIGARNLKEILIAYVPGMTFSQDHNEVNVAMRGVYASSQQKFLILVNGHILNSRSYATANPDFSIGLDNIARIEVLRGPASSLYGQGALAAVVNLITKRGGDVNATTASVGGGTAGQVKVSGLFGGTTSGSNDILTWGTFYRSDGQTVTIPPARDYSRVPAGGTAIVDGFKGPPSHDVGVSLKTGAFTVLAAHRYSHYIEPFTAGGPTGEVYRYEDYQAGNGVEPGLGMGAFNLGVTHERVIRGTTLSVRGYMDRMEIAGHVVADPTTGAHSLVGWKDWDAGIVGTLSRSFATPRGEERWTAGVQVDAMRVDDSALTTGTRGGWGATSPKGALLEIGSERTESVFIHAVQPLARAWTANAGVRYDRKYRREGENLNLVSPHAALVYTRDARTNVAVSYAKGFVDAPYWYRYNSLASYQGSRDLEPEYLHSVRLTPETTLASGATVRATVFFDHLDNLVWRNKAALPGEPTYQNAGFLKTWGLEPELHVALGTVSADANLTYQRVISARNYDVAGADVHNVPSVTWNVVTTVKPEATALHDLAVSGTVRYVGKQLSPVNITIGGTSFIEPARIVDRALLVDAGVRAGRLWSTAWFADARLFNLFDAEYEQGGSVAHPYPQAGRSALIQIGRRFRP